MKDMHLPLLAVCVYGAGLEYMRNRPDDFSERMRRNYQLHGEDMNIVPHMCARLWARGGKAPLDLENRRLLCWRVVRNIYHAPVDRAGDRIERRLNYADLAWANFTALYLAQGLCLGKRSVEWEPFRKIFRTRLAEHLEYMRGYQIPCPGPEQLAGCMLWRNCFVQTRDIFEECGYYVNWKVGEIARRSFGGH